MAALHANRLLALLPQQDLTRIKPHLQLVSLQRGQVLFEAGEPIQWVYFPVGALFQFHRALPDGSRGDVVLIDNCACGPVPFTLHQEQAVMAAAVVRQEGLCYRLPVHVARQEMLQGGGFVQIVLLGLMRNIDQLTATSVCLRRHTIEQTCAKWLLMYTEQSGQAQL